MLYRGWAGRAPGPTAGGAGREAVTGDHSLYPLQGSDRREGRGGDGGGRATTAPEQPVDPRSGFPVPHDGHPTMRNPSPWSCGQVGSPYPSADVCGARRKRAPMSRRNRPPRTVARRFMVMTDLLRVSYGGVERNGIGGGHRIASQGIATASRTAGSGLLRLLPRTSRRCPDRRRDGWGCCSSPVSAMPPVSWPGRRSGAQQGPALGVRGFRRAGPGEPGRRRTGRRAGQGQMM